MKTAYAGYEVVTNCDLCGSDQTRMIDEPGCVVQCKKCGLKFVNRRPSQKDVAEGYDWSFEHCPGWGKIIPEAQLMYQRRFDFFQRFIREGALLDVGAGLGTFLSLAKNTGNWKCFGTETSRYAVNFAQEKFTIELSLGQLGDLHLPPKTFDAVCFWHVLEHLPYPSRAIKETKRILKKRGFLFIAVPNDSWLGRRHFFKNAIRKTINRLPIKGKLRLKKMYPAVGEQGNKHLSYFTPRTLKKLLRLHGFRIKKYSVDFDYERPNPKIERSYQRDLFLCNISRINFSNAILIAAQKE